MYSKKSAVALIPARSGSRRVPGKNVRALAGHPLMAYTVSAALESGVFASVVVSTDSEEYAGIARRYGAQVPFLRPGSMADEKSQDIDWVDYTLRRLRDEGKAYDCFSILRPTNPFRLPVTIRRAWKVFLESGGADSLRAVEKCRQHPGKMWVRDGNWIRPFWTGTHEGQPWHSTPYQALPEVFVQNASLEIAWCRVVFEQKSISGERIVPFFTEGTEGFDINDETDWLMAERLLEKGAPLPGIPEACRA